MLSLKKCLHQSSSIGLLRRLLVWWLGVRWASGGESLVLLRAPRASAATSDSTPDTRADARRGTALAWRKLGRVLPWEGRALPSPLGNKRFARAASRFARWRSLCSLTPLPREGFHTNVWAMANGAPLGAPAPAGTED